MQHKRIPFQDTRQFSPFFLDYIHQKDSLKQFYNRYPQLAAFNDQIAEKKKSFPKETRKIVYETLKDQYKQLTLTEPVKSNLELLKAENTFTITTGHQLNIFTGPLYFIYKIVSVINACKQLKEKYPSNNFVPVYWMASEDHDFEEISTFRLYGKKYTWKTDQHGAVGHFDPKGLKTILDELPGNIEIFRKAYLGHETLSDAVRYYVNELFGEQGLVVVDADNRALKELLKPVMEDDVFTHTAKEKVESANAELNKLGYHTQVHAREINFFYLDKGVRARLEREDNNFKVVDTDLHFTEAQLRQLMQEEPEKFSPNVILRPVYQEIILPNLAYVGGPAEIIYWLQLKGVFDFFRIPFPILMPRNFAMILDGPTARKFSKTGLAEADLFEEKNYLFNDWVLKHTHHNLTLTEELKVARSLFDSIKERAVAIDSTLGPLVGAEAKRSDNSFEKIERKLLRAEKRLHTEKLRQIDEVKEALFPNGGLQERSDNFLNFYQQDPEFIKKVSQVFDPFDFRFNILSYSFS